MSLLVIGCDPGPTASAVVMFDGERVLHATHGPNEDIEEWLRDLSRPNDKLVLVLEKVESFGMAVGAEVFETVFHTGRFTVVFEPCRWERLPRRVIKQHLCHTARATDANIRQALLDRFGGAEKAIGKKASQGPLYGLKGHLWSAFAVAITWFDMHGHEPETIRPGVVPEF